MKFMVTKIEEIEADGMITLIEIDRAIRQIFNVLDLESDLDSSLVNNFNRRRGFEFWKRGNSYSVLCPIENGTAQAEEEIFNDGVFYSEIKIINNYTFLEITILNVEFKDFYVMIISDMIFRCFETDHNLKLVIERYQSWREFINLISVPKTDIGLLGELFFLKFIIENNISNIHSWTGPEFATHDFKLHEKFIEIKTTLSKYKNLISINGMLQLNNNQETALCLIRVEKENTNGFSIKELVSDISEKLNSPERAAFENKLKRFSKIVEQSTDKFIMKVNQIYPVDEDFPKISDSSFKNDRVPKGISYISYLVDLSNLDYHSLEQYFEIN